MHASEPLYFIGIGLKKTVIHMCFLWFVYMDFESGVTDVFIFGGSGSPAVAPLISGSRTVNTGRCLSLVGVRLREVDLQELGLWLLLSLLIRSK